MLDSDMLVCEWNIPCIVSPPSSALCSNPCVHCQITLKCIAFQPRSALPFHPRLQCWLKWQQHHNAETTTIRSFPKSVNLNTTTPTYCVLRTGGHGKLACNVASDTPLITYFGTLVSYKEMYHNTLVSCMDVYRSTLSLSPKLLDSFYQTCRNVIPIGDST